MKSILKRLALLCIPLAVYLAFFAAFEPNNYFGLKAASASTAPIARIKAYVNQPGDFLLIGDSRLAHFDLTLADETSGKTWQNLAFGGASLRECIDLVNYLLDRGDRPQEILFGLSFYTLNASYDTDRMSALEDTLNNPLAYIFNLEYNVNTLTALSDRLAGRKDVEETGEWGAADYIGADGQPLTLHRALADYPATIAPKCAGWALNTDMMDALYALLDRCNEAGVKVSLVLPPMAQNVRGEICNVYGITDAMADFLPQLAAECAARNVRVLDYEWDAAIDPANALVFECNQDTDYYDGFHLDTVHGLPRWTEQLFAALQ